MRASRLGPWTASNGCDHRQAGQSVENLFSGAQAFATARSHLCVFVTYQNPWPVPWMGTKGSTTDERRCAQIRQCNFSVEIHLCNGTLGKRQHELCYVTT